MNINDILIVDILNQDTFGRGIARYNNFVLFIDKALPDEKVKISVTKLKKNYGEGKILEILESSSDRRNYKCNYYNECGGCNIGHQKYMSQINFKINKIKNPFNINNIKVLENNEFGYRNKVVLRVKNNKVGFFESSSNNVINIDTCLIANNKINELIKELNNFKYINDIEEITIRSLDETIVNFKTIKDINKYIIESFKFVDSIYINNEYVYGKNNIKTTILDLEFIVSINSFFQVNIEGTKKLYNKIIEYANLTQNDNVLDLYCGVGTISLLLAKHCKNVLGIEINEDAIKNANMNKQLNNISNVEFICGKVENELKNDIIVDILVLDPPRSGVDNNTINIINNISPNKIIYVSCNPDTLNRDLKNLNNYKIDKMSIIDMFPNTYHIETVCLLIGK